MTYTADQVGQIVAYAKLIRRGSESGRPAPPPGLLRQVGAVLASPTEPLQPGTTGYNFFSTCALSFQLTNIGSGALEIPQAGVKLTSSPEPTTATVPLIDICSTGGSLACQGIIPVELAKCGFYTVQLQLQPVGTGEAVLEAPTALTTPGGFPPVGLQCPALIIGPGQTVDLRVDLWSAKALTYQIEPVLTVNTTDGQKPVLVTDQAGTAAFGDPASFVCYRLNGQAFQVYAMGSDVFDQTKQGADHTWCL